MIDIHTHIIYDVDDGSDTLEESVAILKNAFKNGVTDIILTPHYLGKESFDKEKVLQNFEVLKKEKEEQGIDINLYLGNEVAVYGNIIEILEDSRVETLAKSSYMLIEFPMSIDVPYITQTIYEMKLRGVIPVIAHPERCECFSSHLERVKEAVNDGAYIQCNTGSIMGLYGRKAKKIVKKLLKENLVSFLATDTHKETNTRYEDLKKVEKKVEKLIGTKRKNELFSDNAKKILLNEDI